MKGHQGREETMGRGSKIEVMCKANREDSEETKGNFDMEEKKTRVVCDASPHKADVSKTGNGTTKDIIRKVKKITLQNGEKYLQIMQ